MRILHVLSTVARRYGGPSEVGLSLARAQSALGHQVRILSTTKDGTGSLGEEYERELSQDLGLPVRLFDVHAPRRYDRSPGLRRAMPSAIEWADIVHVHNLYLYSTTWACHYARRARTPYVLQPHGVLDTFHRRKGSAYKGVYHALIEDRNLGNASGIIVNSEREMQALPRVFASRGAIMPLGVEEALFGTPAATPTAAAPHALFLGRLAMKKQPGLVVEAVARVRSQGHPLSLTLAGPVHDEAGSRAVALARSVLPVAAFHLAGQVDSVQRRRLLATRPVFVLPSLDESFGVAAAEAAAAGCAIVTTDAVGCAPDLAAAGGALLHQPDAVDLADKLALLCESPELRAQLGEAARAYALTHYRWSAVAQRSLEIYAAALRRSTSQRSAGVTDRREGHQIPSRRFD